MKLTLCGLFSQYCQDINIIERIQLSPKNSHAFLIITREGTVKIWSI